MEGIKRIGLLEVDSDYPNLALMKISSYHKSIGDQVEWYNPFDDFDVVYKSKIFTFTPDYPHPITNTNTIHEGGTGYSMEVCLNKDVEIMQPDYSIYPSIDNDTAYGFITRGCPNKCRWCVVPKKEGSVHAYMDVDDIAINGRNRLILMDNNILASSYGLDQIAKIVDRKYIVDFNQGLDARLVTDEIGELLAKVRWIHDIRFGCDTHAQIDQCIQAMDRINRFRKNKAQYMLYTMLNEDLVECYERLSIFRSYPNVVVHAQPFRDPNGVNVIPEWQKDMARWANRRVYYKATDFKDFSPRKGFSCGNYFN